jgi:hypothetical protein
MTGELHLPRSPFETSRAGRPNFEGQNEASVPSGNLTHSPPAGTDAVESCSRPPGVGGSRGGQLRVLFDLLMFLVRQGARLGPS